MAENSKVRVTVTIVVQRGNKEWRGKVKATGDEIVTTPGPLDFLPLEEMAERLMDAIYEDISDGPNPDWDS